MARSQLVALPMAVLLFCTLGSAVAHESRRMLANATTATAEVTTKVAVEHRELWIDPAAKPSATGGWDVIISIVCPGKYNTVAAFSLRNGLGALGLPTSPSKLAFGGNAAQAGYTYMASFTVNIAGAKTQAAALAAVARVSAAALSAASKVKINTVFFSAFSVSG